MQREDPSPGEAILAGIERTLLSDFDPRFGGFGTGQKFPHPEVLDYALMRHVERRDPELSEILTKTLSAQVGGALRDTVDGGFFRCCAGRDWTRPHTEKTTDGNLGLARVLIGAGLHLGRPEWVGAGTEALAFIARELRDPYSGLLAAGLAPDEGYYALMAAERRTRSRPKADGRVLAQVNARAAVAFARGSVLLGALGEESGAGTASWARQAEPFGELATQLVNALVEQLWRPGRGLVPVRDTSGDHPGDHLADLAEVALALLVVLEQTGDRELREPIDDLLAGMAQRHLLPDGDLGDHGPEGRPLRSLRDASVAAQAWLRAAALLGRPDGRDMALASLRHHAPDYRRHGDQMATFGRALSMAMRPPVQVVLVGPAEDPVLGALRLGACRTALIERVVLGLDPEHDSERLAVLGLAGDPAPRACVLHGGDMLGAAVDPDALAQLMARAGERRRAQAPLSLDG